MNRFIVFFKSRSFALLLFHLGVLVFNWPILSMPSETGDGAIFSHLLIAWAIFVTLLIFVGQSIRAGNDSRKGD